MHLASWLGMLHSLFMTNANTATETAAWNDAIEAIKRLMDSPAVMAFVTSEARAKVAEEIRAKCGGKTTAKAVELLEIRHPNIKHRVQHYTAIGLMGVLVAANKAA